MANNKELYRALGLKSSEDEATEAIGACLGAFIGYLILRPLIVMVLWNYAVTTFAGIVFNTAVPSIDFWLALGVSMVLSVVGNLLGIGGRK